MATIPWLADVLRSAGVSVVEHGNWLGRVAGSSFAPIGVLWHHTAAASASSTSSRVGGPTTPASAGAAVPSRPATATP
ncbi:hypothetical protein C5N14_13235 [Micromonospora sp. MW-13]|uniref:hypothetical protein n=1 Tax=Micromonospora sp. MW-13 TaxID=2094022 RepID=UPI000EC82F14|nr:hypothetical protein [Micromonospora sp. MW-13]RGC68477.1 hypothetical protein C5N14_13235 [Micromonospora sp. MW-13]